MNHVPAEIYEDVLEESICMALPLTAITVVPSHEQVGQSDSKIRLSQTKTVTNV